MIYRKGELRDGVPVRCDTYDHEDLRGVTVTLADPENTQFIGCTFSDMEEIVAGGESRWIPVNQVTIIANGYGREYLENCEGIPIEVGA